MLDRMCYKTDVGKVRPHNEDAVTIYQNPFCTVMVVADGMGGMKQEKLQVRWSLKLWNIPLMKHFHLMIQKIYVSGLN